jgi:RNA polymerase sigma-70 factor (ECF subfamily)
MSLEQNYDMDIIYRTYYQDVYRYVSFLNYNRAEIEDIVQNTFLKAMQGMAAFRGDCTVKTWLLTLARNESIRYGQKIKKHLPYCDLIEEPGTDTFPDYEQRELMNRVVKAIQLLEEPKRTLMILRLINELSYEEIGRIIDKSDTWCRVNFMRIKRNIIEEMEENEYV